MTETKLLTVKEASLLCTEMGLTRTTKTIRNWARLGHVEASKQTTAKGFKYVLDKGSLEAKIKEELEFMAQTQASQTLSETSEPIQKLPEHSEPFRKGVESSEPFRTVPETPGNDNMKALNSQIQVLKIDVGWRDKLIEKLERENEKGNESLMAQARFIGHLETKLERLGGAADQKYLEAPIPASDETPSVEPEIIASENARPHPDQQNLYTGRT